MKNSEIIEMTTAELIERVETEKAALNKMTMNHTITPMENPMQIRAARKTIILFDDFDCFYIKNIYEKVVYIKIMYEICDI